MNDETTPGSRPSRGELALATFLFLAFTLALTYPLSLHAGSRVCWAGVDTELYAWTLAWNTHALTTNPLAVFDANIFYPLPNTLAYSENLIGATLFAAPVIWLTDNPVLALNVASLASCLLCGLGTYLLARRLGLGRPAAVLAGIVFAFSPPRFARYGQLHLTSIQWMPFALASLHAYLDEGRARDLRLAVGLFSLQALTSGHGAVFLALTMAALFLWRVALGDPIAPVRRLRDLGMVGALLLLPSVLIILPYHIAQAEVGLRRSFDYAGWHDWRSSALSYIASPALVPRFIATRFISPTVLDEAGAFLFPGILPLVLAAFTMFRRRPAEERRQVEGRSGAWRIYAVRALAALLGVGAAACFRLSAHVWTERVTFTVGGHLVRIHSPWRSMLVGLVMLTAAVAVGRRVPVRLDVRERLRRGLDAWRRWREARRRDAVLFYTLVMGASLWVGAAPIGLWPWLYWLPGFNFIRVPSRFTLLALLALSVLVGFGFERAVARLAPRRRTICAGILAACLAGEFAMLPFPNAAYDIAIPEVDRWLDTRPKPFAIMELPLSSEADNTRYMMHATAHWQKTVNGYSGIRPPLHVEAYPIIRKFPDRESLEMLARLGVTYVVVHSERYPKGVWPVIQERIAKAGPWVVLEHAEGTGRVYSLHPPKP